MDRWSAALVALTRSAWVTWSTDFTAVTVPCRTRATRSLMAISSSWAELIRMTDLPAARELVDEVIDGEPGADVDALGRFVEDDDLATC